jgi:hypothetical protein
VGDLIVCVCEPVAAEVGDLASEAPSVMDEMEVVTQAEVSVTFVFSVYPLIFS